MAKQLDLKTLSDAVSGSGVAFRCCVKLQPAGGEGTKVFPPTYAGSVYATEKRRLPCHAEPVGCVLLDSVQSQANRMEEALQQALDAGRLVMPIVEVDFTPYFPGHKRKEDMRLLDPVGKVSTLQAPHRIADAILRDSMSDGAKFRETDIGKRIGMVSPRDATALFEYCPTALVFGMWDSTGPKGGLGAKFERAMVAEIVGINAVFGVKSSSRIDPLGVQKNAGPLYRKRDGGWTTDPSEALHEVKDGKPTGRVVLFKKNKQKQDVYHEPGLYRRPDGGCTWDWYEAAEEKDSHGAPTGRRLLFHKSQGADVYVEQVVKPFADQGRPSEANHGNVTPSLSDWSKETDEYLAGGVTISHAEQTVVLSLPALRRLHFPVDGNYTTEVDNAARTVLAALGLCAATLAAEAGLDLRSRCLLWPVEPPTWSLLDKPGEQPEELQLGAGTAIDLLKEAVKKAKALGLPWQDEPVVLTPSDDLVKLVVKSQHLAAQQGGDAGEGGD